MARVITFSTVFPAYHHRAGEPTHFVEKILASLVGQQNSVSPKNHTIRAGNRWKIGDKFSPIIWSLPGGRFKKGNKQIQFAPDIEIKKIFDIYICFADKIISIDGCEFVINYDEVLKRLATNDGLRVDDFIYWFGQIPFTGQIICWNENVNY